MNQITCFVQKQHLQALGALQAPAIPTNSAVNSISGTWGPPDQPGFGGFEEVHSGVDISALRHRPVIKISTLIDRDLKYTRICSDPDFGISVQNCTELAISVQNCTELYRITCDKT